MYSTFLKSHAILAALLVLTASVAAEARARLRPSVVLQGQSCLLEVEIEAGRVENMATAPAVAGLAIQPVGANRVRRGSEEFIIMNFEVTPETATGKVVIPPFPIELANGGTTTTNELILHVLREEEVGPPPPPNRRLHCLLLTPGRDFFSGERFPMQVLVLVDPSVQLQQLDQPKIPRDGVAVERLENPLRPRVRYAGRNWQGFSYATRATAIGAGEVKLGPPEARATIAVAEPSPDGFQRFRQFPLTAKGEELNLNIRPFPEGAPDGFTGVVGQFSITAAFDPAPARPGDPIAVQLVVEGTGDESQLTVPKLADESAWEVFEGVKEVRPGDSLDPVTSTRFRRILRPLRDPGAEIPPFRLVYLNPVTGKYETAESAPLVLPTAARGMADLPAISPASGTPVAETPAPEVQPHAAADLLLDPPPLPAIRDRDEWLRAAALATHATGAGFLMLAGAVAWWKKYRASPEGIRAARRRALRMSLRAALAERDDESRLLAALRWHEEWNQSPFARPLTRDEAADLRAWRDALARARYAPDPRALSIPPLARLERLLLSPS
jgi:hypothetical protein